MKATIIYDNTAEEGYQSGWGLSCLVDQKILFDTGKAPDPLFYNMDRLNVDVNKIEAVVISHDHWDHAGGLWELLKKRKGLTVYACPGFSADFKKKVKRLGGTLIEAESHLRINQNISVTGEIPGEYKGSSMPEQALMVKTERGITVITGCSHPGIVMMIQKAKAIFPRERIALVLGGFHLMNQNRKNIESIVSAIKDMGVEKIGPTHCTGQEAQRIFKNSYKDHFLFIIAGQTLDI